VAFGPAGCHNSIGFPSGSCRRAKPHAKVSWQVTGIRHDTYANANRIQVEDEKPANQRGTYLHPELFGAPATQTVGLSAPTGAALATR
jgi:trimeric autotransporter adhesin